MMRRRNKPGTAVLSYVALFVALGGTAYASHLTVLSDDIVDGEVKTADLGLSGVTSPKVANDAVNAAKIANGTVGNEELGADAVTPAKVMDNSLGQVDIGTFGVSADELAPASVGASEIQTGAVFSNEIAQGAVGEVDVQPGVLGKGWLAYRDADKTIVGGVAKPPFTEVLTLDLPAGRYMLSARVQVHAPPLGATCDLQARPASDIVSVATQDDSGSYAVPLMTAGTFSGPVTVRLRCRPPGGYTIVVGRRKIMATRVGQLSVIQQQAP
jgi:hypothetical protein